MTVPGIDMVVAVGLLAAIVGGMGGFGTGVILAPLLVLRPRPL
jgi:uncharacterized membrane protein YfcA